MCRNTITKTTSNDNKNFITKEIDDLVVVDLGAVDNKINLVSLEELDIAFKNMEDERLEELRSTLWQFFSTKVVPLCSKNLKADNEAILKFMKGTITCIVNDMLELGENEPCGINGGIIVVNLRGGSSDVQNDLRPLRLGKLPISHKFFPTYELQLTLIPSNDLKYKMENMLRRFQAMPPLIVIDQKYELVKKQMY